MQRGGALAGRSHLQRTVHSTKFAIG
jgi:hypothetical protein